MIRNESQTTSVVCNVENYLKFIAVRSRRKRKKKIALFRTLVDDDSITSILYFPKSMSSCDNSIVSSRRPQQQYLRSIKGTFLLPFEQKQNDSSSERCSPSTSKCIPRYTYMNFRAKYLKFVLCATLITFRVTWCSGQILV